jgi:hypothetical protein
MIVNRLSINHPIGRWIMARLLRIVLQADQRPDADWIVHPLTAMTASSYFSMNDTAPIHLNAAGLSRAYPTIALRYDFYLRTPGRLSA